MTKLKLLSAGLIAAAATPAARYIDGRLCNPAPRVNAFATAPWENETPCEPTPGY